MRVVDKWGAWALDQMKQSPAAKLLASKGRP
jgi:hypothetical protein